MGWKQEDKGLHESDVVKWTEAMWAPNRRRKQRRPWGKQEVTAQITGEDGEFLSLKILKSEVKESNIGAELKPHKVGSVIRKKRQTLMKGNPERLLWSEESVRAAIKDISH